MASRREIKRRIRSITNTSQITKALQLVSASRMRRAQARSTAARPYAGHIRGIVHDLAGREGATEHPLLAPRDIRNVGLVIVSPDRGMAGALVTNLKREILRVARDGGHPVRSVAIGRKGRDFAVRSSLNLVAEFTQLGDNVSITDVGPIAQEVLSEFENGDVDIVYLISTRFITTLRQQPQTIQLLPVVSPDDAELPGPWNYEPDNPALVLSELLPRYVEFTIYQAILESIASEHSARMIAMSNATENALDLIQDLTLLMNKARQAEITKEIAEISGAAEAIRTG